MQPKFTSKCIIICCFILITLNLSGNLFAQSLCPTQSVLFLEDFGAGTLPSSSPDVTTSLTYQPSGNLSTDGVYRVTNSTLQNTNWHNSPDHTGNANGKMLVLNGNGNVFYSHTITNPAGFQVGFYSIGFYFMNVNLPANCPSGTSPTISFLLEYQAQDNSWVAIGGSSSSIPLLSSPVWIQMGTVFALPSTSGFTIQNLRFSINDGIISGCGNDFAIDDIKLSGCTGGGPLPVEFSNVSAKQKGTGVSVNWSTLTETNNKYFDVERSTDGGANWAVIATNKTSGSSSAVRTYNAFDSKPIAGKNFYRIKQVDIDGKFKYSIVVNVKFSIDQTVASVLTNPFVNNISIDFWAKNKQNVYVILLDATGKTIVNERWNIINGTSRKTLDKVSNIQKGIYILKIVDQDGGSIYNGKLVKQ